MNRGSKLFTVVAALIALAIQIWLVNGSWPGVWMLAGGATVAAAVAASRDRRAVALVLVFAYAFPLLIRLLHGRYHIYLSVLWLGPLLGAMLPQALTTPWQVPARWRIPLAAWAMVIAAAAVIGIARESDFYAGLWFHEGRSAPLFAASWILHIALPLIVGILWFDWICGARDLDVVAWIAAPLAIAMLPLAGVAIYQALVDITFYNESIYWSLGRATGTMFDSNVCATIAAFWVGGAALIGERFGRFRWPATLAGMAIAWMAVWATASRTGFGASFIATIFVAVSAWRSRGGWARFTWKSGAVALIGVVAAAVLFNTLRSNETGPVQRLAAMLPDLSRASFAALASELWNRNGYGEAATLLIQRHPWFGIGIGAYHEMGPALAWRELQLPLVPDNAQSWYRHQLVELGVVGSVAWMLWVVSFAGFVIRRDRAEPAVRSALRGALLAFAFVSLFGMPAQDVSVALTFWTFAGLYVALRPEAARPTAHTRQASWWWIPAVSTVVVFAVGTWSVGMTTLRPPFRARDNGLPYRYGFNAPEPDGAGGMQQWARQRAVAVVEAPTSILHITISVNHLDLAARPVHARVWCDGRLAIDTYLSSPAPVSTDVIATGARKHILVETAVDRVVRPSDFGVGGDGRELGLLVSWRSGGVR